MSFCGIICEYNPLHKGHVYHLQKTAEDLKTEGIICVMSGNFVQRGLPATFDKYTRAKWAILSGADLVLELPAVFSVAPAPNFAFGAVKLLTELKCVNYISFGSEYGDIKQIENLAKNTDSANITNKLKSGKSFASSFDLEGYKSNNILGAEYLKAIEKLNSNIKLYTVKRAGAEYNDFSTDKEYCSASAIRNMLNGESIIKAKDFVPDFVYEDIKNYSEAENKLFYMLIYKILTAKNSLKNYAYISEGLHSRIYASALKSTDITELKKNIYTKRYPQSKVNRILINILLNITKNLENEAKKSPLYAKVLAVKKGKENIISEISKNIKVIARANDYKSFENQLLYTDILATDIYSKISASNINDISAGLKKY